MDIIIFLLKIMLTEACQNGSCWINLQTSRFKLVKLVLSHRIDRLDLSIEHLTSNTRL